MEIANKILQLYFNYKPLFENLLILTILPYLFYTIFAFLKYELEYNNAWNDDYRIPFILKILYYTLKVICISTTIMIGIVYVVPYLLITIGIMKDLIMLYV